MSRLNDRIVQALEPALVVVAVDRGRLRTWLSWTVRCAGHDVLIVDDRAALFEAMAALPAAVILGDRFDAVDAPGLLAMIRAAGCAVPALVIGGAGDPEAWGERASAFEPIDFLPGAAGSDASARSHRSRAGRPRRCAGAAWTSRPRDRG